MIGKTVSHYRIVGPLGAGGMGVVYSGEDIRLGRPVALKFVPEDLARDRQAIERLNGEARTASGLNHASICTIYDIGEYEGQPFIVMELLKGQTLRDRLASGPLKTLDVVDLGIQVADALDSAHRRDIIHRDIKPANLFLVDRGPVKVLDFGLAKLLSRRTAAATTAGFTRERTAEGVTLGTVSYMSPEQVTGEELDGRTDLFSLGVVLYEALTGHQPFTGKTSAVIFSAILTQAPVAPVVLNPALPLRLQEVVNNCLEKDRELRYQDAAGLRADLKRVKRDLESGRSGVFTVTGLPAVESRTQLIAPPNQATAPSSDSSPVKPAAFGRTTKVSYAAIAAIAALAAVLAAGAFFRTLPRGRNPSEAVPPPSSSSSVRATLALAAASIESKDYRAALVYADEVLRVSPGDKDATRIRDAAVSQLSARVAGQLEAGDRVLRDRQLPRSTSTAPTVAERPAANEPTRPVAGRGRTGGEPVASASEPAPPRVTSSAREVPEPPDVPSAASSGARPVSQPMIAAASPPAPVAPPPAPPAVAPRPDSADRRDPASASGSGNGLESDDAAIRRVVATYARAIETKDLALFRSVKPNLSADEQRRIEDGFRAVASQQVSLSVTSIDQRGSDASVRLRRRDTIRAGGRQQTADSLQTMTLMRSASGWVIQEIGR
jgi:serine/threonine protein kinase